jgi:general secretion pathway protein I
MTVSKYHSIHHNEKGFTLLEVMLSVSIIALIMVSLFRLQSGSIALASANKFNQLAPILAKQLMAKIGQDFEGWSQTEGDFGDEHPGIVWTSQISDAEFDNIEFISQENLEKFKKIHLEIKDKSSGRSFKMTGWRLADE